MFWFASFSLFLVVFVTDATGHGMLLDPAARGSRWRFNASAPINYNDNEEFCGGFNAQWLINGGKCGLCGDDYREPTPRPLELGGFFGEGIIVKKYTAGRNLPVGVLITANHRGHFIFHLCNLDENNESEDCFQQNPLELVTGGYKYVLQNINSGWFNTTLVIPEAVHCNHCVLRWTYITGNFWGICQNEIGAIGCGPQEHFRGCSDISIDQIAKTEDIEEIPEVD